MTREKRNPPIKHNLIDRTISYFSPVKGAHRLNARLYMNMASTYYTGASRIKRQTKEWGARKSAPDSALLERGILTDRGHDLHRNAPIARGAVQTNTTNVIGSGLMLQPRINRDVLNLTDEQAEELETKLKREFNLWADSLESDVRQTMPFNRSHDMAFSNFLIAGDVFNILRNFKPTTQPYSLACQLIEGARVSNPGNQPDTVGLVAGVKKNELGAPVSYFVSRFHPGMYRLKQEYKWDEVQRFGAETGLQKVIHLFKPERPGQTRGISWLAPIVELLHQLTEYTEAEITAAVIAGMFTVFIKTASGELADNTTDLGDETGATTSDKDYKIAPGLVMGLKDDESVETANPGRPNTAFEAFVEAIMRQIGVALNIPFEILIKHFTSSYSASRAALMEAWKFFTSERKWFARMYCQPVYEAWLFEAVSIGRISAPGFFNDPMVRSAYSATEWSGPPRGMIDELKEIKAADLRVAGGYTTLAEETAALTGGDWSAKHPQRKKEKELRVEDGLEEPIGVPAQAVAPSPGEGKPDNDNSTNALDVEDFRRKVDAYSIGVRAGTITPQPDDEEFFRDEANLPTLSKEVKQAWTDDGGVRRPITLQSGKAFSATQEALEDEDADKGKALNVAGGLKEPVAAAPSAAPSKKAVTKEDIREMIEEMIEEEKDA